MVRKHAGIAVWLSAHTACTKPMCRTRSQWPDCKFPGWCSRWREEEDVLCLEILSDSRDVPIRSFKMALTSNLGSRSREVGRYSFAGGGLDLARLLSGVRHFLSQPHGRENASESGCVATIPGGSAPTVFYDRCECERTLDMVRYMPTGRSHVTDGRMDNGKAAHSTQSRRNKTGRLRRIMKPLTAIMLLV